MLAFHLVINTRWNVVYLPMGHTAKFVMELSTSLGIIPKDHLEHHGSYGPRNTEIHRLFEKLLRFCYSPSEHK